MVVGLIYVEVIPVAVSDRYILLFSSVAVSFREILLIVIVKCTKRKLVSQSNLRIRLLRQVEQSSNHWRRGIEYNLEFVIRGLGVKIVKV